MEKEIFKTEARSALLLGATGLVGGYCLDYLLNDNAYEQVIVLGRRKLERSHPKLEEHIVDFNNLQQHTSLFQVDDVFCCLGSTLKKAGSQEAFRQVDYAYPVKAAKLASIQGVRQFIVVSALGANPRSLTFYNRVKGDMESDISKLIFESLLIFQPSIILGEREEKRILEAWGVAALKTLAPLMKGPLKKAKPIHAKTIAFSMLEVAKEQREGCHRIESDEIQAIYDEKS
ncbi:NAD(P)H-binding protein [Deltaproteobacteria bacterium TL4]